MVLIAEQVSVNRYAFHIIPITGKRKSVTVENYLTIEENYFEC